MQHAQWQQINFCEQSIIPTKTVKVYPNNKTYITKDIKQVMNLRKLAYKNKDTMNNETMKTMTSIPRKHHKVFVTNHELASANLGPP